MGLSHEDVREILRIIDESELEELRIETEGFSLHVRKGGGVAQAEPQAPPPTSAATRTPQPPGSPETMRTPQPPGSPETMRTPQPPAAGKSENETESHSDAAGGEDDGLVAIPSPMLGTFYRAESPGAAPFVEVGAEVGPDTTVCIIEVMKMMNSVPAGVSGTVQEVCPTNGQLVEYGEPLFRVRAGGGD
jgi:acetyl-CoA carboxylase biotin carboxyl carrier protein